MLNFKQFLSEEFDEFDDIIELDAKHLAGNRDSINSELDVLTAKPYQNAPIFLSQLRGCLERYGILLPASATANFLDLSAELVYLLGSAQEYLYVVYDTSDDGHCDGYAQIVSEDELNDLLGMDPKELLARPPMTKKRWIPPARWDDDSGNTNEYPASPYMPDVPE